MTHTSKQTVMKTLLIVGILLTSLSEQALGMGHPHNVFAARKQMRAKTSAVITQSKTPVCPAWQSVVQLDKNAFSKRLLAALSRMRPARAY